MGAVMHKALIFARCLLRQLCSQCPTLPPAARQPRCLLPIGLDSAI